MAAKDTYHDHARNALLKDGWTITHDPLVLSWGPRDYLVDLGAEKLMAAEKGDQRIAVEVKSFIGPSPIEDLKVALGQFVLYHDILASLQPQRTLYLAIRSETYVELFEEPVGKLLLQNQRVRLIVFSEENGEIVQWLT